MKNKAFTLLELLITVVIVGIFASVVVGSFMRSSNIDINDPAYWNPEMVRAQAQREQAEQLRIQNEIAKRQLELLEKNNQSK